MKFLLAVVLLSVVAAQTMSETSVAAYYTDSCCTQVAALISYPVETNLTFVPSQGTGCASELACLAAPESLNCQLFKGTSSSNNMISSASDQSTTITYSTSNGLVTKTFGATDCQASWLYPNCYVKFTTPDAINNDPTSLNADLCNPSGGGGSGGNGGSSSKSVTVNVYYTVQS